MVPEVIAPFEAGRRRLESWVEEGPRRRGGFDLGLRLVERDRTALASVLGAAIALRLFLFVVPLVVALTGLVNVLGMPGVVRDILGQAKVGGSLAGEIESAATHSQRTGIGLLVTGGLLTIWAGRSLTSVLVAAASSAWRLPPGSTRSSGSSTGASAG